MPAVAECLRRAPGVVTTAAVQKHLKAAGHGTSPAAIVVDALERLVQAGHAHRHPGATAKSAPSYGLLTPRELVAQALAARIATGSEFTLTVLRGVVPKSYRDLVDEAIGDLQREGKLFDKPGAGKTPKFTTRRPSPTSVLSAVQRKSLEAILSRVNPLRTRPLEWSDLLGFLDGSGATPTRAVTLEWLVDLYRQDLPARGGLSSMPIPWTWKRYSDAARAAGAEPDRSAFERTLLEGMARGRVEITPHERPVALSPDERAAAIAEPNGGVLFYWRPIEARS